MNDHMSLVMNDLVPTFEDELGDWSDVLARVDTERTPGSVDLPMLGPLRSRGRRGRLLALGAGIVAATAASLVITTPWSGTPTFLERASAALTLNPGIVLHEEFEIVETDPKSGKITRHLTDVWNGPNGRFRAFLRPGPGGVVDEVGSMSSKGRILRFDPATNSITDAGFFFRFGDPVPYIRKALTDGQARDVGKTTISGRIVEVIEDTPVNGDASRILIDPKTYDPVEVVTRTYVNGAHEPTVIKFLAYERLPATPANLRLANIKAVHPSAKIVP